MALICDLCAKYSRATFTESVDCGFVRMAVAVRSACRNDSMSGMYSVLVQPSQFFCNAIAINLWIFRLITIANYMAAVMGYRKHICLNS